MAEGFVRVNNWLEVAEFFASIAASADSTGTDPAAHASSPRS
jgi:hypothetical protein